MSYNLTPVQKDLLVWLVEQAKAGFLSEEFFTFFGLGGIRKIGGFSGNQELPNFSKSTLDALINEDLLGQSGNAYSLTGKGYEAVENKFDAPDMSFIKYLTPLDDITKLDIELKERCLPALGAGGDNVKLWDNALRTAGAVLEDRIRDVGKVSDFNVTGQKLITRVFSSSGPLAHKFKVPSELESYRELLTGIYGAVRNPSAHRLLDKKPEQAGATLMFINVLLEMLEELR